MAKTISKCCYCNPRSSELRSFCVQGGRAPWPPCQRVLQKVLVDPLNSIHPKVKKIHCPERPYDWKFEFLVVLHRPPFIPAPFSLVAPFIVFAPQRTEMNIGAAAPPPAGPPTGPPAGTTPNAETGAPVVDLSQADQGVVDNAE